MCAVTGHNNAFGRRIIQPAFSPATKGNRLKGPYFNPQTPEYHPLQGSPLLLYLKDRKSYSLSTEVQGTGGLRAAGKPPRAAWYLAHQQLRAAIPQSQRAKETLLTFPCSGMEQNPLLALGKIMLAAAATADGAGQSSSLHLPSREHTPVPGQIQTLANPSWWSPESLHSRIMQIYYPAVKQLWATPKPSSDSLFISTFFLPAPPPRTSQKLQLGLVPCLLDTVQGETRTEKQFAKIPPRRRHHPK